MKNEIRTIKKLLRANMLKEDVKQKSRTVSDAFLKSDIYKMSKTLMLYMPLGNETDTSHIINTAFSDGKKVAFPVTDQTTGEITPFYAKKDTKFSVGAFSINEPVGSEKVNPADIDTVVIPGIAFGINGTRVGFGKGCYDRFLAKTNAVKIGCCYEFQICDNIPSDAHDVPMDYLVSERGLIKCIIDEGKYE